MNRPKALYNGTFYTGYEVIVGKAILINNGHIEAIVELSDIPQEYERYDLSGANVCAGLIDLQIYGTGEDLFSAELTSETINRIEQNLLKQGCTSFYLTLATNTIELFKEAIAVFKSTKRSSALGLHLEGPFLNAVKRGAHPEDLVIPITVATLEDLFTDAGELVKIMTIAPELASEEAIQYLQDKGLLISAGHSNSTFRQAYDSFEKGISAVTHLWNAMSTLHHRNIGLPGAVFNHPTVNASIIVDGIHVDYEAVKLSKKMMGERLFLITDAVASCSKGIYQHVLNNDHYVLPDGTLSGSALTLLQAVGNCVRYADIELDEAIRMATLYPARLMKLTDLGQLARGYKANITVFNDSYEVTHVFLGGEKVV